MCTGTGHDGCGAQTNHQRATETLLLTTGNTMSTLGDNLPQPPPPPNRHVCTPTMFVHESPQQCTKVVVVGQAGDRWVHPQRLKGMEVAHVHALDVRVGHNQVPGGRSRQGRWGGGGIRTCRVEVPGTQHRAKGTPHCPVGHLHPVPTDMRACICTCPAGDGSRHVSTLQQQWLLQTTRYHTHGSSCKSRSRRARRFGSCTEMAGQQGRQQVSSRAVGSHT